MLLWGVVGLLDVRKRQREFRDWRQRRWAPKSPHECQTRLLNQVDRQLADERGVSPEKGEPGGDPATAGDGVGHELIHQAGDPGICGYLHLQ